MGFYNTEQPLHRIFGVYSFLVGVGLIAFALTLAVERLGPWVPYCAGLIFAAILFIASSVVLIRQKSWGRILLSFLLHCLIIGVISAWVSVWKEMRTTKDWGILEFMGPSVVFLTLIIFYSVMIALLHSSHFKNSTLGFYYTSQPLHRLFAVFSGLVGMAILLLAIVFILVHEGPWIVGFIICILISILCTASSIALFSRRSLGKHLLSFPLHILSSASIAMSILGFAMLIIDPPSPSAIIRATAGMLTCYIMGLSTIVLIAILHSKRLNKELL